MIPFGAGPAAGYAVLAAVVFSVLLVTMLEFHKCGHRARQPRWVRLLQKSGLLLSVTTTSGTTSGNHDYNYCLINGWADRTLGRLGLFRGPRMADRPLDRRPAAAQRSRMAAPLRPQSHRPRRPRRTA